MSPEVRFSCRKSSIFMKIQRVRFVCTPKMSIEGAPDNDLLPTSDSRLPTQDSGYVIIFSIMGQITIEIPQSVNRNYRLITENSAQEVLSKLETLVREENKVDDDEILGLWADRKESVEELARNLRRKSNDRSLKK